jgi:hypothetical protein
MKTGGLRHLALMLLPFMFAADRATRKASAGGSYSGHANFGTPTYQPKRTRFKGYMRENRRCSFNKNK